MCFKRSRKRADFFVDSLRKLDLAAFFCYGRKAQNLGLTIVIVALFTACSGETENTVNIETYVPDTSSNFGQVNLVLNDEIISVDTVFAYQLMESEHGGFGYKIFQQGKLYISQPHIPAVQGMNGFSTSERATTTALFAISKLQQGIFPPMITVEELDSLGVID